MYVGWFDCREKEREGRWEEIGGSGSALFKPARSGGGGKMSRSGWLVCGGAGGKRS